ncbi:RagB/SusD family nutrient uptake outer membrane protein [uncultured Chitinophaga sp.]|uniref:RagB/SusD family nutrient uptake outer membrane protein n=1 Tax=uncultured Chitinophaga sp. TaxID=339340 RepID=UPI00260043E6|nr:RagB/SusD family nutrient uptake outer membrane protein [uncultured Chitinophaga sp.]
MTNKYLHIFKATVVLIALSLTSCDSFLAERPSKNSSLEVKTANQLEALLNNTTSFYTEGNRTAIHSTDDYGFSAAMYKSSASPFSMATVQFATWDYTYLPDDTREGFWSTEYRKIFTANMVLSLVGTVEGTEAQKANLTADAHFVRAYSYFQLASTYCLPLSDATKNEPGLPIKLSTSFEEDLKRAPLAAVYKQIESDLLEALKIQLPLMQENRARHWRASKAGVNGFAARYYLTMNNLPEALKYAEAALSEYSVLVDYNTEMRYGRTQNVVIDPGKPESKTVTLQYPYTHDNQSDLTDMIGWKEFLYFRMLNHESWWYIPSQSLLGLYDQDHDLRYRYHVVENYSYDRGMINPSFDYPGYIFFFKDRLPSGPTVAEMLLIKAEVLARTNKPGDAATTLNQLRAKRLTPGAWVNLTATTADEAIKLVLEERRREMPFTQRWQDIRRYNNNDYAADDVTLTRDFYPYTIAAVQTTEAIKTYTLPKGSRRFAAPIPRTEMIASNDVIEQNTY